jgi:hypothetical protein
MRALLVVLMTMLLGCKSAGQPGPASAGATEKAPPADTAAPVATATSTAAASSAPEAKPVDKVDLTRGQQTRTHGLEVMLRGTSTTHPSTTVTLNRAELEISDGNDKRTISLEREQPGDAKFVDVLGLQLALDSVDASAKPSTARILVRQ